MLRGCFLLHVSHVQSINEIFTFHSDEVQIVVFWVVVLCSDVVGYQRFGEPSGWRWRKQSPPKCW